MITGRKVPVPAAPRLQTVVALSHTLPVKDELPMRMEAHSVCTKFKPERVIKAAPVDKSSLGATLVMQPASNIMQQVDIRAVWMDDMERVTGRLHLDCRSIRHEAALSLVHVEAPQLVVYTLIWRLVSTVPKPAPESKMGIELNSVAFPAVGWLETMAVPVALGISDHADVGKPSMLKTTPAL